MGGSVFSGPSNGVTLTDSILLQFLLEPVLSPGDTLQIGSSVSVNVDALSAPGIYTLTYQIFGGDTNEEQNLIGQVNFQVEVSGTQPQPVPEPATLSLLGLGFAGAAVRRFKKRR